MTTWGALSALRTDAVFYAAAAIFAYGLGLFSGQAAMWHWGYLATVPYALAAIGAWWLGRRVSARETLARIVVLIVLTIGVLAVPLGLEAHWRQLDHGRGFAQPEVAVIERAANSVSHGKDPYRVFELHGHLVNQVQGIPAFESFFPYFPLMSVFGLPSAASHQSSGLTDARIVMSLMTLVVSGLGLTMLRASRKKKIRVAQVLIALPTGALFLATGGDDMPILALSLLGVAALQRRTNYVAGVSLGLAAAMKLTVWPLAAGGLLVAYGRDHRRVWKRVALVAGSIVVLSIAPFAVRSPGAFISNVVAFPLGLTSVKSPAASALPGHLLASQWPLLGHVLAPVALLVLGYFLAQYLYHHWPINLSQLLGILSVGFTVMICVASATRIGYVIYPLNFLLWSKVCQEQLAPVPELV